MQNPFKPGNGIEPPYLAGREEELRWFEKSLTAALTLPRNLVISGIRGTGKTVLLKEFEDICRKKNWLFIQREFNERHCNETEFIHAILTDVITKVKGASIAKKLSLRKPGFMAEEIPISGDFLSKLLSKYPGPLGDRLEAILKDLYFAFNESGFNGLVLLYDEFHMVKDKRTPNDFPLSMLLETFGHVQKQGMRYYLVLSGLPPLFPNLVEAKTYAERMFSVKKISSLTEEATIKAITEPLKDSSFTFEEALTDRLTKETRGYPYFIQFYCHYLIDNVPETKITSKDFERIHPLLLRELDESFFMGRFEKASDSEAEVLFTMAKIGSTSTTSELLKRLDIENNLLQQLLLKLIEKGLIYRVKKGVYTFSLPLFREFLLRRS